MKNPESRFGGPDRVAGIDKQTEKYFKLLKSQQILENQELSRFEREKTPEEVVMINDILKHIPNFIKEYGAASERYIDLNQIHILEKNNSETFEFESFFEKGINGRYTPFEGRIDILSTNIVDMVRTLVHELIHAQSFYSITVDLNGKNKERPMVDDSRRLGIATKENESNEMLFRFINEALTEELTKKFCEQFLPEIDTIKDNFVGIKKLTIANTNIPEIPPESAKASLLPELIDSEHSLHYSYTNERLGFLHLIDELYEANQDQYSSRDEIFKLFSTAMFNGDLLPVARLIEKSFGKGAFRKIGQMTKNPAPEMAQILARLVE